MPSSQHDRVLGWGSWVTGVNLSARKRKTLLSMRIDDDVLEWFRSRGPGYQTRMHAVLRAYMEHTRDNE